MIHASRVDHHNVDTADLEYLMKAREIVEELFSRCLIPRSCGRSELKVSDRYLHWVRRMVAGKPGLVPKLTLGLYLKPHGTCESRYRIHVVPTLPKPATQMGAATLASLIVKELRRQIRRDLAPLLSL